MVNLLFQETSNLLLGANVTLQKPVSRKAGDSKLFLDTTSPYSSSISCPPLPLLFTSVHPFIILRKAPLATETPLCTQVLLRSHSSPQHALCVNVGLSVSRQKRARDGVI